MLFVININIDYAADLLETYSLVLLETTTTLMPMQAIRTNDALKVAKLAMKPMIEGATKKPEKPMVDTAAKATPGAMVFDFPAAL